MIHTAILEAIPCNYVMTENWVKSELSKLVNVESHFISQSYLHESIVWVN